MQRLIFVAIGLTLLGALQANAHTRLTAATPAEAAVTTTGPDEIVLEFNGDVRLLTVTLETADAHAVELGAIPDTWQQRFVLPVLAVLPAGEYTVAWRAVGADTHAVAGEIHFNVSAGESLASQASAGN